MFSEAPTATHSTTAGNLRAFVNLAFQHAEYLGEFWRFHETTWKRSARQIMDPQRIDLPIDYALMKRACGKSRPTKPSNFMNSTAFRRVIKLATIAIVGVSIYSLLVGVILAIPNPPFSASWYEDFPGRFCNLHSASPSLIWDFTNHWDGGDPIKGTPFVFLYFSVFVSPLIAAAYMYKKAVSTGIASGIACASVVAVLSYALQIILYFVVAYYCIGVLFRVEFL
jgi:hypothetical protein